MDPSSPFPRPGRSCHLPSLHLIALLLEAALILPSLPLHQSPSSGHSASSRDTTTAGHAASVFRIVEELPVGTIVGNVKQNQGLATLHPKSALSKLQFSFRHSNDSPYLYFSIDRSSGLVKTSRRIDRDDVCRGQVVCRLLLEVVVQPIQFFRIIQVFVNVEDVNDNAPHFPVSQISLEVNENVPVGSRFPLPRAVDADSRAFGVKAYAAVHSGVDSGSAFDLNTTDHEDGSKDVSLVTRDRLDRESRDAYVITVVAYDGGSPPKSASLVVGVAIGDANDNSPVFDEASYAVGVSERRVPNRTPVGRVHATDRDADKNGEVHYGLEESTEANYGQTFGVDPLSGDIFLLNSLDYERQRSYVLVVMATDLGTRSLSSFTKVTVTVEDENDNAPKITLTPLSVSGIVAIPENSDPGTPVAHLVVADGDSGQNSVVECSVYEDHLFKLEQTPRESEYRLVTSNTFDREDESHYAVTLTCHDQGQPPLTVSKVVEIEILDENDNAPELFHGDPVVIQVDENNSPGVEVGRIDASDRDAGSNSQIRFNLTSDELTSASLITLNPITGRIRVNEALDYERQSDYTFQLKVFDLGDPSQTTLASLVLRVRDTNDERPRFEKPAYYFFVTESLSVGSSIGFTMATDADRSLRFSQITYRTVDPALPFRLDPDTGQLFLARKLDREDAPDFRFVVIAQNQEPFGHVRSDVNVTVYVDDVNDNRPIVLNPAKGSGVVYITDAARNGSLVTRIDAWDPDEGRNAKLTYSISHGNDDSVFHIDAETGAVTVVNQRHRDHYNLVIVVRDRGDRPLMSVVDLVVKVNRSGVEGGQGQSFFSQLDGGGRANERLIVVIGVVAAFVFIVFVVAFILLVVMFWRRRRRRHRKKVAEGGEADHLGSMPLDVIRRGSTLDSELNRYSGSYSGRFVERCSNKDCPFGSRRDSPIIPIQTPIERERRRQEEGHVDGDSETNAHDNTARNKKLHDDSVTRLSCDEVMRSRVVSNRTRMLHDADHVVPTSKSCDFIGSAAVRLRHIQEQNEMQRRAAGKPEVVPLHRDSYDCSDCSDSCIDSGLDPNEDCDHVTYAAMTESCASYLPVN